MSQLARIRAVSTLTCVFAASLYGQTEPVTLLDDLVTEMLQRNPAVKAAQHRFDAATKRPSQVSTLPDPKISVTNVGVGRPFSTLGTSNFAYLGFGFSQEIPYPGKLALAGEQASKETESERQMYRALVLGTVAELRVAYFEWFGVTKSIDVTSKNRELLDNFEKISRTRYSVGKGPQQDVLRAQVELSTIQQQLELLNQRKGSIEARIQSLLGSNYKLGRPADLRLSPVTTPLETLLSSLEDNAPALKAKQAILDSRATGVERARKGSRPDFGVTFQWQKTGAPFRDYYMAAAEVRIPLYFWRNQRLGIEESVAKLNEAKQDYLADRQEFVFQIKDEYLKAKTSERLLALYQSGVIPQSSLALESSLAGYEAGNVDFLSLMNNFMTVLNYEMQYYEELAKHAQAVAKLEALVAAPLAELERTR